VRIKEDAMGKDSFRFGRIGSREEVAEYLSSLAQGLKRGEVSLESGERMLHLVPAPDMKIELQVKDKEEKGKIAIEIGWKRRTAARAADLDVRTAARPSRA
jgi:amphi-Trp domain-containing protein